MNDATISVTTAPRVEPIQLLAVIVVYKMAPENSPSLHTLLRSLEAGTSKEVELSILIQDNTPGGQTIGTLPDGVRYESAPHNPGLAYAYNRAISLAQREGYEWILTLDQDTSLPEDFLTKLSSAIKGVADSAEVAAIVPRVTEERRTISPFRLVMGAYPKELPPQKSSDSINPIYAINSSSTLRVSALFDIGGYDPAFPLDISDLNLFHELSRARKKVFFARNILVRHNFSLLEKSSRMSIQRYQSLLLDECAFWDINMGPMARLERLLRLIGRVIKDLIANNSFAFQKVTLAEIKRRLVTRKARRIEEWKTWAEARMAASSSPSPTASKILS